jgi:hypothetical protein
MSKTMTQKDFLKMSEPMKDILLEEYERAKKEGVVTTNIHQGIKALHEEHGHILGYLVFSAAATQLIAVMNEDEWEPTGATRALASMVNGALNNQRHHAWYGPMRYLDGPELKIACEVLEVLTVQHARMLYVRSLDGLGKVVIPAAKYGVSRVRLAKESLLRVAKALGPADAVPGVLADWLRCVHVELSALEDALPPEPDQAPQVGGKLTRMN